MTDNAARVTDLEIRLAHQDRMIEDLSDMVTAQGRAIDLLTDRLRRVAERLRELETDRPGLTDDRPPPHY